MYLITVLCTDIKSSLYFKGQYLRRAFDHNHFVKLYFKQRQDHQLEKKVTTG